MKLALYRLAEYPKSEGSVYEATKYKEEDPAWVRVSEIVEVDFPPRDQDEIIQESIIGIDNEIAKELRDHLVRVSDLKRTKSELLSLAYEPPSERGQPPSPPSLEDDIPF